MEFKCYDCNRIYEAEGKKVEYTDPLYGPCSRVVAECPVCGSEGSEYRKPKAPKGSASPADTCPSYHNGSCGCCH